VGSGGGRSHAGRAAGKRQVAGSKLQRTAVTLAAAGWLAATNAMRPGCCVTWNHWPGFSSAGHQAPAAGRCAPPPPHPPTCILLVDLLERLHLGLRISLLDVLDGEAGHWAACLRVPLGDLALHIVHLLLHVHRGALEGQLLGHHLPGGGERERCRQATGALQPRLQALWRLLCSPRPAAAADQVLQQPAASSQPEGQAGRQAGRQAASSGSPAPPLGPPLPGWQTRQTASP
jgi:hypothetical protein